MRKCNCSGRCVPPASGINRREFLGAVGAATAWLAAPSAHAEPLTPEVLSRWQRTLFETAPPRRYLSHVHTDARMHLGGIGTGNFEIGADGQFTNWQLFNTLRDGHVPFYLGVRAANIARLLQTTGGFTAPRIRAIEMTGDYPLATLHFQDGDLPVQLELTAFTPLAPLDSRLASVPLAALVFRLTNQSPHPQTVSLAAFLANPIGYDALGDIDANQHPNFGGNLNEPWTAPNAAGLDLRAQPGPAPILDRPLEVFVSPNLAGLSSPPNDRPENLHLHRAENLKTTPAADGGETVVWLEEAPLDLPEPLLRTIRDAVQAGATLVLSGKTLPLLEAYARASNGQPLAEAQGRPDLLFEDFESGYDQWKLDGHAFGPRPASGTLPNQQRVSGFVGRGFVNTYFEGDATTGHLTSPAFKIDRNYVRFLVGGGSHANTQIRLLVDGQTVRSTSGRDNEQLLAASWDVREFAGRQAHLEIVDENTGPWGHINIDQIEFSDQPENVATFRILEQLLPARFAGVRSEKNRPAGDPNAVRFDRFDPAPEATARSLADGLQLWVRHVGKGRVVLATGPLLDPAQAPLVGARQRAYARLCQSIGAHYTPRSGPPTNAPGFGTMTLAALGETVTLLPTFTDWGAAWQQFASSGRFDPPEQTKAAAPTPVGQTVHGAVASSIDVPAGASREVVFLVAWHFPNKYSSAGNLMGSQYTTLWPNARAVIEEAARDFALWRSRTETFRQTLYDSTLPWWLLDCLTSQAATIRHVGVVFRIANGDLYGWEGSNGCCQPTCTHVWGYEQTLAWLFPDLERDMRRIDFEHQQRDDGGVNNRTDVPSPPRPTGEQPFADGHASCILKAYREALNTPDDTFFRRYWPNIRRAVDYLIARDAKTHAGEPAGILEDDQWNTYDEALHGVTTFIGAYYLAALRAGEEWARRVGESSVADRFHSVFERGQKKLIELCWNGEYFQQHLPDYLSRPGEVGPGCMSDQLIGQWWAHQLGLGYLLPPDTIRSALQSVYRYNWKPDLTGWRHLPRAFAGDRDKGLIICTWPKGGRPAHVMLYSDEVWTGIEYQVAAHMIYEGLIEEAFAIVKGARDRYDGTPRPPITRNPWNEIECGGHYARAMSSWSLLLALSGFRYDGPRQALQLNPRHQPERFQSFFSGPEGWGSLRQSREGNRQQNEIAVAEGRFAVRSVQLAVVGAPSSVRVQLAGTNVQSRFRTDGKTLEVTLAEPCTVGAGQTLRLELA